jgi:hypothetical protein
MGRRGKGVCRGEHVRGAERASGLGPGTGGDRTAALSQHPYRGRRRGLGMGTLGWILVVVLVLVLMGIITVNIR